MKLIIQNKTSSPIAYASGTISVSANGSLTTTVSQQTILISDGALAKDCAIANVTLSDGYNTYGTNDATDYLQQISANLRTIVGGTDSTVIGNISDRLKSASTLYDSTGAELGTAENPINTSAILTVAPDLLNGRLFCTSIEINAASSGTDNPLVFFRNPVGSGKIIFIDKIIVGISIANVSSTFKVFGQPTTTNTTSTITNITQAGLSTTVTVTTSAANGATVGAEFTVSGTTNFNGTHSVVSVTSSTVFTFTTTAVLITTTNNAGTVVMQSSLGTAMSIFSLKRVASPNTSIANVYSLPTLPSNGSQLITIAQGQNTIPPLLVDSAEISLEPGQNILVTANPSSNNRSTTITIIWSEVSQ